MARFPLPVPPHPTICTNSFCWASLSCWWPVGSNQRGPCPLGCVFFSLIDAESSDDSYSNCWVVVFFPRRNMFPETTFHWDHSVSISMSLFSLFSQFATHPITSSFMVFVYRREKCVAKVSCDHMIGQTRLPCSGVRHSSAMTALSGT